MCTCVIIPVSVIFITSTLESKLSYDYKVLLKICKQDSFASYYNDLYFQKMNISWHNLYFFYPYFSVIHFYLTEDIVIYLLVTSTVLGNLHVSFLFPP